MIKNLMIALALVLIAQSVYPPAWAEERDPFQPFGAVPAVSATPVTTEETSESQQSLMNYPLDSFKLVGVLIAPDQSLAVLQGRDAKDYIVTMGDHVGKEGGTINAIRKEGITVAVGDGKMDMAVSNKVEKVNDKNKQ